MRFRGAGGTLAGSWQDSSLGCAVSGLGESVAIEMRDEEVLSLQAEGMTHKIGPGMHVGTHGVSMDYAWEMHERCMA